MENKFSMLNAPPNRTYRKRLIGEYFYQNGSRFSDTSRAIWNEMRGVNQPDLCGDYTDKVYVNVGAYGVDIPSLIDFVRGAKYSNSPYFDWDNFDLDPTCVEKTMVIERGSINYQDCSSNTIQLKYLNEKQELVTSNTIVTLNKRKCYIEPEVSKQWAYVSNIDPSKKHVSLDLNIYFEKTETYRTYETKGNTFNIDNKYRAIQFSSENIEDILYLIKDIYGESYISKVKKKFTSYYAEALRNCKVGDGLNFLYKKAPDFVITALHSLLGEEVLFAHLETLSLFDEASWFDDSSKAIIKLLKSITPGTLYTYFKNNPYQLKRIFYNLDNASNVLDGETTQSNKSNFANLMTAICGLMSYDGFDKKSTNLKTFYLGNNYKVDTKIDYDNDPEKDKYFLQQLRVDFTTATDYVGDEKVSIPIEREIANTKNLGKGDNLHPLAPVYLVTVDNEGNKSQPTLVPAIYIKAMAHQTEVADTMQNIRIGANILALIIGVASLGSASPLIVGLAALDILVSGADLIIISQEKKLMETEEGKAFLKNWETFSLLATGPSVLLLGRSILIGGAKLLSKMTVANARNFVMACMIKVIIKNNITRFVQNTIEFLPAAELFKISSAGHKIAETLNNLGAFFVKGKIQKGAKQEELYAIIYKGEAIFEGTKRDLDKQIGRWSKKPQHKLGEIIDELSAIKSYENGRVGYVEGLYDSIDVHYKPKGFKPIDIEEIDANYGKQIRTKFEGFSGYFIRNFDTHTKTFTFNHGFLQDLPGWVNDVKIPLVQGKGIPTQAYFTLRQMKLLGIAKNEIKKVKMATIQNLETMAYIHNTMQAKRLMNITSVDILAAPSNEYVKTVMTQACYELVSGKIVEKAGMAKMSIKELKNEGFVFSDDYMKKYSFTNDTHLYINFDIEIIVKPLK